METILFLCPHGAAKSVLAAAIFQHLADQRGLALRAASAGTDPDTAIPEAVIEYLRREELPLLNQVPRLVTDDDLKTALRIVSIGCEVNDRAGFRSSIQFWNEVPAVSQDLSAATREIWARVERLVSELAEEAKR